MNTPESGNDRAEHRRIVNTLTALRNAHEHMTGVFLHGSCYELFQILHALYPEAEPWKLNGHVYTRIRGRFYDIRGQRELSETEIAEATPKFERRDPPHRWRDQARERRMGFRTRTVVAIQIGWEVKVLQALHRAWRAVRHQGWRIGLVARIVRRVSVPPEETQERPKRSGNGVRNSRAR